MRFPCVANIGVVFCSLPAAGGAAAIVIVRILMIVIGYGINMDVENLSYAVLDNDQTEKSTNYGEFVPIFFNFLSLPFSLFT